MVEKLPASTVVAMRPFSASDADIPATRRRNQKMRADGPPMLMNVS
jgi:hypothetical protein